MVKESIQAKRPADTLYILYLPQNLRYLRLTNNMRQANVAAYLHIERSTYTYYELGRTSPSILSIVMLSKLFRVTIDDLLLKNCSENLYTPACKRKKL